MIDFEHVYKTYETHNDENVALEDINIHIDEGEFVFILGHSGAGKSTFLKLIMNEEEPDTGWIRKGPAVRVAYLPQIVTFPVLDRSIYDTMLYETKCTPQSARDRLAAFGFMGEDVFKPVGTLSGGERSRLKLCMLMGEQINLLILDEPTNHLDIASREWVEAAIEEFEGVLLFVSHDRYFIEKFAERIWLLENGTIRDFRCGYEKYRSILEHEAQAKVLPAPSPEPKAKKERPRSGPKDGEKLVRRLEREIEKQEQKVAELEGKIQQSFLCFFPKN